MIKIGQIYSSKNQPVAPTLDRRSWGTVTDILQTDNSFLIEADYGIVKGDSRNIFMDVLTKEEFEKYTSLHKKECAHYHIVKPFEKFYNSSSSPDGKQSWCKQCTKEYKKTRIPRRKKCSKCGEVKSSSEFYKVSGRKDGLSSRCKDCDKEHGKLHRKATATASDTYLKPSKFLMDATEKELIDRLRSLGNYKIVRIETIETEL